MVRLPSFSLVDEISRGISSITLHWRHNDHGGWKKASKLRVTGLCAENSPGPMNSPHKWPVTRKMFPVYDVIMNSLRLSDAYMSRLTKLSLGQIMACRMFDVKPSSETKLFRYQLEAWENFTEIRIKIRRLSIKGHRYENFVCKTTAIVYHT